MSATTNSVGTLAAPAARAADADHAEVRLEGRERVVGDLRLGRGDPRDERGLAGVREADERHVGDELQLEVEPALLADLALLGEGRRAEAVREEAGVAPAPAPAARGEQAVAGMGQVGEHGAVQGADDGAHGDRHDEVATVAAVAAAAAAVGAVLGTAGGDGHGTRGARRPRYEASR